MDALYTAALVAILIGALYCFFRFFPLDRPAEYSIQKNIHGQWIADEWEGDGYWRLGFFNSREKALEAIERRKEKLRLEKEREWVR